MKGDVMANDDWFEGRRWSLFRTDEDAMERCYWRRVGFVIFAAIALALILSPLGGCSTAPVQQVCFVKRLGNTEAGMVVVAQTCMSPEQFAETQK